VAKSNTRAFSKKNGMPGIVEFGDGNLKLTGIDIKVHIPLFETEVVGSAPEVSNTPAIASSSRG
jgi:hypothetical protein